MTASAAEPSHEPDPALAAGTPDQPVGGGERIVALDFIRGIAVLMILFPNIVAYGHPMLAYLWPEYLPGGATAIDRWAWLVQLVLIDGKFRGLFTLLFGAGMALFADRVAARGGSRWLQPRRLFWLMLFGLAHTFLLWTGDILLLYAVAGFGALLMLGWEARTQLTAGIVWFLAGALFFTAALGSQAALEALPALRAMQPDAYQQVQAANAGLIAEADEEVEVTRRGSYGDIVEFRVATTGPSLPGETLMFALVETLPLMLLGMALYRLGLFDRRFDRAKTKRWAWSGVIGGAVLTVPLGWWVMDAGFPLMLTQFVFSGATALLHLPMVLGLAALLALWAPAAAQGWLGSRFVAVGRMAFSNYLGTSLLMLLVFQGWAGGLYGELHRAELFGIVLGAWLLMLAWSKPWLARFRYGPLEWLWRCLTYGRLIPLRR